MDTTGNVTELTVRTEGGTLRGRLSGSVAAFRGIPYAAPPVHELRWRPPAPSPPWAGTRSACAFGPAPLQPQPPRSSLMWHSGFADSKTLVMSEDCLYLNVWSPDPAPGSRLPVMVFLHGGGHRFGHGGAQIHDGAAMASRGLVVVTVNMRLGVLGFLAHPALAREDDAGASGNYGLQDVVAALAWVQRNIGAFGGDRGSVTLAGNSAGAAIITHLMAAPAAKGLFHRAIGQSSSGIFRAEGPLLRQEEAQTAGLRALGPLGSMPLNQLRNLDATALLLPAHLGIVIDGRLVVADSEEAFRRGDQSPIPLLVGTNRDEGSVFNTPEAAATLRRVTSQGPHASALASVYPTDQASLPNSSRAFTGDTRFVYPVWRWAQTHQATSGAPTWLYRFDREPPLPGGLDLASPPDGGAGYGVFHSAEIMYASDNLRARAWPWKDADRILATTMSDTWAAFVATADPNHSGLPHWDNCAGAHDDRVMAFDEQVAMATITRLDALRVLDSIPRPL